MIGIPLESALGASLERYRPGWGNVEELLATVAELVDRGNAMFHSAHSKRGAAPPTPLRITRPHDVKKRRPATSEDLVEMFGSVARFTGRRAPVPDPREDRP